MSMKRLPWQIGRNQQDRCSSDPEAESRSIPAVRCRGCRFKGEDVLATPDGLYYFAYCSKDFTHVAMKDPDMLRECSKWEMQTGDERS